MDIFRDLANQGKCVILVSHSPDVAAMCDERYELLKFSGGKKKRTLKVFNKISAKNNGMKFMPLFFSAVRSKPLCFLLYANTWRGLPL